MDESAVVPKARAKIENEAVVCMPYRTGGEKQNNRRAVHGGGIIGGRLLLRVVYPCRIHHIDKTLNPLSLVGHNDRCLNSLGYFDPSKRSLLITENKRMGVVLPSNLYNKITSFTNKLRIKCRPQSPHDCASWI